MPAHMQGVRACLALAWHHFCNRAGCTRPLPRCARCAQAVMSASGKRFIIDQQSDPVEFLSWLVNTLHHDLTGGKRKKRSGAARRRQGRAGLPHSEASGCSDASASNS